MKPSRRAPFSPLVINGQRVCVDCREAIRSDFPLTTRVRCDVCRQANMRRLQSLQSGPHRAVRKAILSGVLPHPSNYFCDDCGGIAAVYDHRDYTKPLDVDPVCQGCNVRRGPADRWFAYSEAA